MRRVCVTWMDRHHEIRFICISLNSSPPNAAYMRQYIGSALVQIMACAYSAPSHYLNQRWVIINWTLRNKLLWIFNQNTKLAIHENASGNFVCETAAILSRWRCVKTVQNLMMADGGHFSQWTPLSIWSNIKCNVWPLINSAKSPPVSLTTPGTPHPITEVRHVSPPDSTRYHSSCHPPLNLHKSGRGHRSCIPTY